MISILLLLILAWSFYIGYRRGIILQAYYLVLSQTLFLQGSS